MPSRNEFTKESDDWKFIGVLGYVDKCHFWDPCTCTNFCSKCKPFVVKSTEIETLINKMEIDFVKADSVPMLCLKNWSDISYQSLRSRLSTK